MVSIPTMRMKNVEIGAEIVTSNWRLLFAFWTGVTVTPPPTA